MPRNGSGTYTLPQAPFVPGTTISSAAVNSDFSDIATALTGSVAADGQTPMTGQFKALAGSAGNPGLTFNSGTTNGFFLSGLSQIGVTIGGVAVGFFSSIGWTTTSGAPIGVPIGAVSSFGGVSAPTGWQLCYGQAISRVTYALLFAAIGTTFGAGDAVTTFNLPDLRGRADIGKDDMGGAAASRITTAGCGIDGTTLGAAGGAQNVTLIQANLPNVAFTVSGITLNDPQHNHDYTIRSSATTFGSGAATNGWLATAPTQTSSSATGITVSSQGSAASGGSATPVFTEPPAIIFNKIIYAGA